MGILLIISTFICFFYLFTKISKTCALILLIAFLGHIVFLCVNAWLYQTGFMWVNDASSFHKEALQLLETEAYRPVRVGVSVYVNSLVFLYKFSVISPTIIVGQFFSIFAWLISVVVLKRFVDYFNVNNFALVLLLYVLNPYDYILTVETFREPFQILFIMLVLYFAVLLLRSFNVKYVLFYFLFAALASLLHGGIAISLCFISAVLIVMIFQKNRKALSGGLKFMYAMVALCFVIMLFWIFKHYYTDIFEESLKYTSASAFALANTVYPVFVDSGELYGILFAWLYYMFYPFPWEISNLTDLYACAFGTLRLFLLFYAVKLWFLEKSIVEKKQVLFLLICFFCITIFFAIGTASYGNAMRHHVLSFWILILLGIKGLGFRKRIKLKNETST